MQFDAALHAFGALHQQFGPILDGLLLLFVRMLAFCSTGPIFNRKNIPIVVKIIMAMYLTGTLFWMVKPEAVFTAGQGGTFVFLIIVNALVGALIGFIADMILQAAYAAGNLINNQIGLSSATLLDPASGKQAMILETLFAYLTILLFLYLGGMQWMILALHRSLEVFPLFTVQQPFMQVVDLDYLITVSGNILTVGVTLMAPVMVVTMAVDIMLGIVNRAAQQMPVFQLSFALKPAIGVAVLLLTLPIFMQALSNFLNDFSKIF